MPTQSGPSWSVGILDRTTYRYLGERNTYVEDACLDGVRKGEKIVDWTAVVHSGIVDEPGQEP